MQLNLNNACYILHARNKQKVKAVLFRNLESCRLCKLQHLYPYL